MSRKYNRGMTILEILIALALSMIVLGAILTVYLTTLTTSGDTLKSSRLNQEVMGIISIMANDIRRAGYASSTVDWDGDAISNYQEPNTNPFSVPNSTALEVRDTASNTLEWPDGTGSNKGDCILFAYDASNGDEDTDGNIVEKSEYLGYRLKDGAVQTRRSVDVDGGQTPNSCATDTTSGLWETLSDQDSVQITKLEFDLSGSRCVNTLEPDNVDNNADGVTDELKERDCYLYDLSNATERAKYPADEPVPTIEVRNVVITIEAQLVDDPSVKTTQQQQVTVRNNLVQVYD